MQCFICVTYMIIIGSCHPGREREAPPQHEERSLFRDVIESLRIRSQLPEDQNEENNLAQNYERFEDESPRLPSDTDFIPRRNDRIEMPRLKYRFPKSLETNESNAESVDEPKQEIVVYIDTTKEPKVTTQKPKKQKRPVTNKIKNPNKKKEHDEDVDENETAQTDLPLTNTMSGQSQIGNRETQMVIKPTVIVNFRGTVTHRDSDIRLESKRSDNDTSVDDLRNIFNIKQEVRFDKLLGGMGSHGGIKRGSKPQPDPEIGKLKTKEEDMMMCETATWNPDKTRRESRKYDSVLQILFSI